MITTTTDNASTQSRPNAARMRAEALMGVIPLSSSPAPSEAVNVEPAPTSQPSCSSEVEHDPTRPSSSHRERNPLPVRPQPDEGLHDWLLAEDEERAVEDGKLAWKAEKTQAKKSRERWLQIGDALLVGKDRNPATQDFSRWCDENGFGDMKPGVRSDAMWMMRSRAELQEVLGWFLKSSDLAANGPNHPTSVRKAYNEALKEREAAAQAEAEAEAAVKAEAGNAKPEPTKPEPKEPVSKTEKVQKTKATAAKPGQKAKELTVLDQIEAIVSGFDAHDQDKALAAVKAIAAGRIITIGDVDPVEKTVTDNVIDMAQRAAKVA